MKQNNQGIVIDISCFTDLTWIQNFNMKPLPIKLFTTLQNFLRNFFLFQNVLQSIKAFMLKRLTIRPEFADRKMANDRFEPPKMVWMRMRKKNRIDLL